MSRLSDLERTWDIYGRHDPMWAALMDPKKRGGKWDAEEFFATGEAEIATVLACVESRGIVPEYAGEALDFGCGVGRLTQALASRFARACGVDISAAMVERASAFNQYRDRCRYIVNTDERLAPFSAGTFSFIYTSVVLQHMETRFALGYLAELGRVLKPGGTLVFQLPDRFNRGHRVTDRAKVAAYELRRRLGIRTRTTRLLRSVGLLRRPPGLYDAVPEMNCVPEAAVMRTLRNHALELVDVRLTNSTDPEFLGELRYLELEPEIGYVSKQYCATKLQPDGTAPDQSPDPLEG